MPHRFTVPERARSVAQVVLLLGTLVLAGALAHQAQDAARSHRATAERALRDYAAIAAWDFGLIAREMMYRVATESCAPRDPLSIGQPGHPLPGPEVIAPAVAAVARCPDPADDAARYYFRLDLRDGSLLVGGAPVATRERAWLADTIAAHAASAYPREWAFAHVFGEFDGEPRALLYTLRRNHAGQPLVAYGYRSCVATWGSSVFEKVIQRFPLLPPAVTANLPNDSLFTIVVRDAGGRTLFGSHASIEAAAAAGHVIGDSYGSLQISIVLRPPAVDALVIGGLPRSRLGSLLGMFVLAAGLIAVALVQWRRQGELARLRADFVSSVSHELRTPLAQIRMFAETLMLGRVRGEDERRRSLEIIDQEARRLSYLAGNVLEFSRSERQATRLKPLRTQLAGQVREALEAFQPLARSRGVELRAALDETAHAAVDRAALRQVLLNLLDNAVKYGPVGQVVVVELQCCESRVRVAVADQGPGIPPRDRERIFQPFFRREVDAGSAVAGSGIGLAVVRDLVNAHGGSVHAQSPADGGARLVVELPACPGDVAEPASTAAAAGAAPSNSASPVVRRSRA